MKKSIQGRVFDRIFRRQIEARVGEALRGHRDLGYLNRSYSQEGEDLILARYFEGRGPGFFVDVGAHHPVRFSNTYRFYLKGWRGINVDAMPGSMEAFREKRPEDVNIECGVAGDEGTLRYHIFNDPALNTFDPEHAAMFEAIPAYHLKQVVEVGVTTLRRILEEHFPSGREIDFLSVDVEGLDLDVLRSNDWSRFRPKVVIFEDGPSPGEPVRLDGEICRFLEEHGYGFLAKGIRSIFYERVDG